MEVRCNKCNRIIDSANINVSKDTAYCNSCGELSNLSNLISSVPDSKFNIGDPVKGTSFDRDGNFWKLEASHRSISALFIVPFACVWVGGSMSGIYGSQIVSGRFDLGASLFGIPFLIGSIVLVCVSLMSLMGRTIISNANGKALIFIGVGSIGWYRRFDWSDIDEVIEKQFHQSGPISLEGKKRLSLGWGLSDKKLYYLVNALRSQLGT